jgi:hypothetical protein
MDAGRRKDEEFEYEGGINDKEIWRLQWLGI